MLAAPNETNTPGVRSVLGGVGHGDSGVDGVDGGDGGDGNSEKLNNYLFLLGVRADAV